MRRIWKFDHGVNENSLVVPGGEDARIVHVGQSPHGPRFVSLWVDIPKVEHLKSPKKVLIAGTGHDIAPVPEPNNPQYVHVGTVEYLQEGLVWHVFEVVRR